jgi:hypothetical protein
MFLTDRIKGLPPGDLFIFPEGLTENQKIVLIFGQLGWYLSHRFNSLREVDDWQALHYLLTIATPEKWKWATEECMPSNVNDLMWKTKLKFLSSHWVGLADSESQKRTSAFTGALMGIRPHCSISASRVADESCKIAKEVNECRSPFCNTYDKSYLVLNQAKTVSLTIGLLRTEIPQTKMDSLAIEFYKNLSERKANAASKAEDRSWKDVILSMIQSPIVKYAVFPADYSGDFFARQEELLDSSKDTKAYEVNMNVDTGAFINVWAEECRHAILLDLYSHKDTVAVTTAMQKKKNVDNFVDFEAAVNEKLTTRTTSLWSFPKVIPSPQAIHTVHFLIFILGPASATNYNVNAGFDMLQDVCLAAGKGREATKLLCYDFAHRRNYEQTVSGKKDAIY